MMRKRPEKDVDNPPGQIVNRVGPDTLQRNIEEWKKWEASRKAAYIVDKYKEVLKRLKER